MNDHENPDHWSAGAERYEQAAHPFTVRYAEDALARVPLRPGDRVLDVAAGTGALALAAARLGARVLATDFSAGMIARIAAAGATGLETAVMDGQALELADASFDAVFSIFGVVMFPDWRKGLAEMARVTRPGGHGVVASWKGRGAGQSLLLGQVRTRLFPELPLSPMPEAFAVMGEPLALAEALTAAGFRDVRIDEVVHEAQVVLPESGDVARLFGKSPDWLDLSAAQRQAVAFEIASRAAGRSVLPVPSAALIAVARR